MILRNLAACVALGAAAVLSSCGPAAETDSAVEADVPGSVITVTHPWSRETAEGQEVGGAFLTISNDGDAPDRLLGGSTPVAAEVQVHTVDMDDGVMRMRQLESGLDIPAGETVTLKPGSFHIMLMGLKQPLKQGEMVPLTLEFEQAGPLEVELMVQPIGAEMPMGDDHG